MEKNVDPSACFRINAPKVVHDIIDGEAVLVHLGSGSYYSTDRVGADVWSFLEKGASLGQIVDEVSKRYEGSREDITQGVATLLVELQKEELILPAAAVKPQESFNAAASAQGIEKTSFQPPRLQKYTDMEDLLLLDPIHDVDETGWPNVPLDEN
jgi:hypothetical protein